MGTQHASILSFQYSKWANDMSESSITPPRSSMQRGFTIIECLIGLAISAVLLTAVAVAFNASIVNYRENEDMFWSLNNARQALSRMTSQIRVAGYLDETAMPPEWYGVNYADANNVCSFWTATTPHELLSYEFRDATHANPACRNKLYLVNNTTHQEYLLCDDVVSATFTKVPCSDPTGGGARSVQISLTVQSGRSQRTLTAAAVVRRIPELYL